MTDFDIQKYGWHACFELIMSVQFSMIANTARKTQILSAEQLVDSLLILASRYSALNNEHNVLGIIILGKKSRFSFVKFIRCPKLYTCQNTNYRWQSIFLNSFVGFNLAFHRCVFINLFFNYESARIKIE